ncbi:hypothetical protein GECvBMG_gp194c [Salmonella phage GEC_vB_MG]|nr:hypothetical protein GECvBMG_gp194c [Salmonella phage GEC_vB_MG]
MALWVMQASFRRNLNTGLTVYVKRKLMCLFRQN